jgi:hypothetical protein
LADLGVGVEYVHDKGVEIDGVETFSGVVKNGLVNLSITASNWSRVIVRTHHVGVLRLMGRDIGGT